VQIVVACVSIKLLKRLNSVIIKCYLDDDAVGNVMDGELKIKCTDVYNMTRTVG
jgi:hypothetical protein